MAFGVFLWVSWIMMLLDSSAAANDYRPYVPSTNLVDHIDFNQLNLDEGTLAEQTTKPADLVYMSYNKPSVATTPAGQSPSTPQTLPESLVNAETRRWQSNLFEPITFPLSGSNQDTALPKLPPTQPQSTLFNVYTLSKPDAPSRPTSYTPAQAAPSFSFASWQPASASQGAQDPLGFQNLNTVGGSDSSNNVLFETVTSYASEPASPPVSLPYDPSASAAEELGKQSSMNALPQSFTATSYGLDATRYTPAPQKPSVTYPLVNIKPYESLSSAYNLVSKPSLESPAIKFPPQTPQAPSENAIFTVDTTDRYSQGNVGNMLPTEYPFAPKKPVFQSAVEAESSPKNWMEVPSLASIFGVGFPELAQMTDMSENSVFNMKGNLPQAYQMPSLPPFRKSFVIRTKNNYQRGRFLKSKTTYTPAYQAKMSTTKSLVAPQDPKV